MGRYQTMNIDVDGAKLKKFMKTGKITLSVEELNGNGKFSIFVPLKVLNKLEKSFERGTRAQVVLDAPCLAYNQQRILDHVYPDPPKQPKQPKQPKAVKPRPVLPPRPAPRQQQPRQLQQQQQQNCTDCGEQGYEQDYEDQQEE